MQLAEEVGFSPPRLVSGAAITVFNKEMQDILGLFFYLCTYYFILLLLGYQFCGNLVQYLFSLFPFWNKGDFKFLSTTYRLFKVPRGAGKPREVVYQGGINGMEESFTLDSQYTFKVGGTAGQVVKKTNIK